MSSELIQSSHKFTPVTIGQPLKLNGASFDFFYTLHSIPCVGFEVRAERLRNSPKQRMHAPENNQNAPPQTNIFSSGAIQKPSQRPPLAPAFKKVATLPAGTCQTSLAGLH